MSTFFKKPKALFKRLKITAQLVAKLLAHEAKKVLTVNEKWQLKQIRRMARLARYSARNAAYPYASKRQNARYARQGAGLTCKQQAGIWT